MAEYTLAHVGINAVNSQDALEAAKMFELLFGLTVKEGNSSVFAGTAAEIMKAPYKGTHGHIGIGTPDVAAAQMDLEPKASRLIPQPPSISLMGPSTPSICRMKFADLRFI